jgi:hypothetical protein
MPTAAFTTFAAKEFAGLIPLYPIRVLVKILSAFGAPIVFGAGIALLGAVDVAVGAAGGVVVVAHNSTHQLFLANNRRTTIPAYRTTDSRTTRAE